MRLFYFYFWGGDVYLRFILAAGQERKWSLDIWVAGELPLYKLGHLWRSFCMRVPLFKVGRARVSKSSGGQETKEDSEELHIFLRGRELKPSECCGGGASVCVCVFVCVFGDLINSKATAKGRIERCRVKN